MSGIRPYGYRYHIDSDLWPYGYGYPMGVTHAQWVPVSDGYRYLMGTTYYNGTMVSVSGLLVDVSLTPCFCRCEVGNQVYSTPSFLWVSLMPTAPRPYGYHVLQRSYDKRQWFIG